MTTILFMGADPTDEARLRLSKEQREIREKLQLSQGRDEFKYEERSAVRPQDISQHLLDTNPAIVHFSGHGGGSVGLCFEDELGKTKLVGAEALEALFRQFVSTIKCVVLNACYSDAQANAISKHITFVVGMNDTINDRAAIAFSVGFYQAIGAKRSVPEAFELGKAQMLMQGMPDSDVPLLLVNSAAPGNLPFV